MDLAGACTGAARVVLAAPAAAAHNGARLRPSAAQKRSSEQRDTDPHSNIARHSPGPAWAHAGCGLLRFSHNREKSAAAALSRLWHRGSVPCKTHPRTTFGAFRRRRVHTGAQCKGVGPEGRAGTRADSHQTLRRLEAVRRTLPGGIASARAHPRRRQALPLPHTHLGLPPPRARSRETASHGSRAPTCRVRMRRGKSTEKKSRGIRPTSGR